VSLKFEHVPLAKQMRDTLPNIFRAVAVAAHWSVNKANNQPFDKEH